MPDPSWLQIQHPSFVMVTFLKISDSLSTSSCLCLRMVWSVLGMSMRHCSYSGLSSARCRSSLHFGHSSLVPFFVLVFRDRYLCPFGHVLVKERSLSFLRSPSISANCSKVICIGISSSCMLIPPTVLGWRPWASAVLHHHGGYTGVGDGIKHVCIWLADGLGSTWPELNHVLEQS